MHESKLEKLYDKATPEKLAGMFDRANRIKEQVTRLTDESSTIVENIVSTVERRFDKLDSTKEHLGTEQFYEMSKQWSIMAASIVRVKHSVKLDSFHSSLNLYINLKYGIKEYKRFVRYSPFSQSNLRSSIDKRRPYKYQRRKLMIRKRSYDEGILDFKVLQRISQLDQDKVCKFMEITKDIVYMTDSWRNFYKVKDCPQLKAYQQMKQITSTHMINDKEYRINLSNLDKLIAFKTKLSIDTIKQAVRWEPMIEKWKEANKNFLVLNELRKFKLKI